MTACGFNNLSAGHCVQYLLPKFFKEYTMLISIETIMSYTSTAPCELLLQIEVMQDDQQVCHNPQLIYSRQNELPNAERQVISGDENLGSRRWIQVNGRFDCSYTAKVKVDRPDTNLKGLSVTPRALIPGDVIKFLMPSRYCFPEDFYGFEQANIPNRGSGIVPIGERIVAMSNWIKNNLSYDIYASNSSTTATTSFNTRAGVCRDYAHILISMVRAVGVPARFVSAYGPNVTPQDFHAVVEVYLEGHWYLIDPTEMTTPSEIVKIGVGRDAADVSFMTSYGWMEFENQQVQVLRVD